MTGLEGRRHGSKVFYGLKGVDYFVPLVGLLIFLKVLVAFLGIFVGISRGASSFKYG